MQLLVTTPDKRLDGPIDFEPIAAAYPRSYTVKGMFISKLVETLGSDWPSVEAQLVAPPKLGRYLPFQNYPQVDYSRIVLAVAAKRFPRVSPREGVRRVARDDLATFADSMIGKVVLALAGDARATLLRVPDSYARVTTGASLSAIDLDARTVRISFTGFHGIYEYTVGQLEGVVMHYGGAPSTSVDEPAPGNLVFDVRHRA